MEELKWLIKADDSWIAEINNSIAVVSMAEATIYDNQNDAVDAYDKYRINRLHGDTGLVSLYDYQIAKLVLIDG